MKNTSRKIISAVSALLLALSMTGCTYGVSSASSAGEITYAEPDIVITEVVEEIPEETEEQKEETFGYISELSEYSSSEEIEYTDYRNNIVEEPVMSIFGNTFNGKSVKSQAELYNEIFYATLREKSIDIIINGNFNPTTHKTIDYIIGGYGYGWEYEDNHYRYTFTYLPGGRIVAAMRNGTLSSLSASDKKLYEKAKQIVNTYTSRSNSDYQNAKMLHDYLAKNCYYDWGKIHNDTTTANDALFGNGGTVCAGYADAYNLLLNIAGIEAYYVHGTGYTGSGSGPHAWNMAEIDGKWVYFDVTWDDPDCRDFIMYDYFAISEAQMSRDHSWDKGITNALKAS